MLKVLIVDDEMYICQLIGRLVDWNSLGLHVIGMANSGLEAQRMAHIENPDIIFMDINMPDMDGLSVVETIRRENSNVSVIFVSGYRDFEYVQQALRLEATDYLLKPVKKADLIAVLRRVVSDKQKEDQGRKEQAAMEMEVKHLRDRLQSAFAREAILTSKITAEMDIEKVNAAYKLPFVGDSFIVTAFKLDCGDMLSTEMEEFLHRKLYDAIDLHNQENRFVGVIGYPDQYIYAIFNTDDYGAVKTLAWNVLRDVISSSASHPDVHLSVGISPVVQGACRIRAAASKSVEAVMNRWILGQDKVIEYRDAERTFIKEDSFFDISKRTIYASLESGARLDAALFFSQFQSHLESDAARGATGAYICESYAEVLALLKSWTRKYLPKEECEHRFDGYETALDMAASIAKGGEVVRKAYEEIFAICEERAAQKERKPIRDAKQYIAQHYGEQLTLENVADHIGFNASYFSNLFKKELGISFSEYLTDVRISMAKEKMRDRDKTIAQIAQEVGYNDEKYFHRVFKRKVKLTVGRFRDLYY